MDRGCCESSLLVRSVVWCWLMFTAKSRLDRQSVNSVVMSAWSDGLAAGVLLGSLQKSVRHQYSSEPPYHSGKHLTGRSPRTQSRSTYAVCPSSNSTKHAISCIWNDTTKIRPKPNTHGRRDSAVELSRVGGVYGFRNLATRRWRCATSLTGTQRFLEIDWGSANHGAIRTK